LKKKRETDGFLDEFQIQKLNSFINSDQHLFLEILAHSERGKEDRGVPVAIVPTERDIGVVC